MSCINYGGIVMGFDLNTSMDSVKDGIRETAEVAHVKTNEFHDNYVSKVLPDYDTMVSFRSQPILCQNFAVSFPFLSFWQNLTFRLELYRFFS